jgi:Na+/alanine symporter
MESLAMLVLILLSIVVFTGPVGYLLTTNAVLNYSQRRNALWIIRRVLVSILSPAGIAISTIFVFTEIPVGTKIMAIGGIALNIFALKREYFSSK